MATATILRVDELSEIFHDVTPLPQNDGPDPVCVISYPTSFVVAYDYMRACWRSGEKSLRSLQLSATCLKLNPANYTVWHYRRVCLDALGYFDAPNPTIIRDDLKLAAQLGGDNPKNYQIWYHRRALLDAFNKIDAASLGNEFLDSELEYLAGVLENDSKNYHAWSHRQWLIRTVDQPTVWDQEMEYGTFRLDEISCQLVHILDFGILS
jgi:protein farnesyltransferase/geranylgeranyltransferase type-1 subunit alpha